MSGRKMRIQQTERKEKKDDDQVDAGAGGDSGAAAAAAEAEAQAKALAQAEEIISLGRQLIAAVRHQPSSTSSSSASARKARIARIRHLVDERGAPTWFQEEDGDQGTGWSALHFAAECNNRIGDQGDGEDDEDDEDDEDEDVVKILLEAGAVWNAVDHLGLTPGDIALSVNDRKSFERIRNEGLRQEILHHAMASAAQASSSSSTPAVPPVSSTTTTTTITDVSASAPDSVLATTTSSGMTLRNSDTTSSGSNTAFLASKLVWSTGDDGRERVLDADGNGVMMGWEEPLMVRHVEAMTRGWGSVQEQATVLNVGYGLGIVSGRNTQVVKVKEANARALRQVDRLFQSRGPALHVVIEAHPQVLAHMRDTGFDKLPGVVVLAGRWQDFILDETRKYEELLALTPGSCGFDAILVDTFAEGYEDLKAFFDHIPDLLEPTEGVFSFWNGLGATSATIYDVASSLAEFHLEDVGCRVEWEDVEVGDIEETWMGVRRKYWDLPIYKLPIARMNM